MAARAAPPPPPTDRGSIVASVLHELGRILPDAVAMMWAPHMGGKVLRCTHVLARGHVSSPLMAEVSLRHPMVSKILYARAATVHTDVGPLSPPWVWASLWTLLGDGTDDGVPGGGDLSVVATVRVPFPRSERPAPEWDAALKGPQGGDKGDVRKLVQHVFRELKQETVNYGLLLVKLPPLAPTPPAPAPAPSTALPGTKPAAVSGPRMAMGGCPVFHDADGAGGGSSCGATRKPRRSFESTGDCIMLVDGTGIGAGVGVGADGVGVPLVPLSVEEVQHLLEVVADQLSCSLSQVSAVEILGHLLEDEMRKSEAVEQAHTQREAAEKSRNDFLCIVNHEMRTPMHAIVAACSLLEETPLTSQQRVYVKTINESATLLGMLVDDVLDVGRLESGCVELDTELFDMADVLSLVLSLVQPIAMLKSVAVDVSLDPRVPAQVAGDKNRLTQTLLNVISNSVKFTDKGSVSVDVSLLSADEYAAIMAKCPAPTNSGGDGKGAENASVGLAAWEGDCSTLTDEGGSAAASINANRRGGEPGAKATSSLGAATSAASGGAGPTPSPCASGDSRARHQGLTSSSCPAPGAAPAPHQPAVNVIASGTVNVAPSPPPSSTADAAPPASVTAVSGAGASDVETRGPQAPQVGLPGQAEEPTRLGSTSKGVDGGDGVAVGPTLAAAPSFMGTPSTLTQKQASAQALRELLSDDDEWFFGEQAEEVPPPPSLPRQAAVMAAAPAAVAAQPPTAMVHSPAGPPCVSQDAPWPAQAQSPGLLKQPQSPALGKQLQSPGLVKQERMEFGPGGLLRSMSRRSSDEALSPTPGVAVSSLPSYGQAPILRAGSLERRLADSSEAATMVSTGSPVGNMRGGMGVATAPVGSKEIGMGSGANDEEGTDKLASSLQQPQPQRPLDLRALLPDDDDDGDEWFYADKAAPAPTAPLAQLRAAPTPLAAASVGSSGMQPSAASQSTQSPELPTKQPRPGPPVRVPEAAAQQAVEKAEAAASGLSASARTTSTAAGVTAGVTTSPRATTTAAPTAATGTASAAPHAQKAVAAAAAAKAVATTMLREVRKSSEDDDEWFVGPLDPAVSPLVGQVITSSTTTPKVYSYDPQVGDAAAALGVKALPMPQRSNTGGVLSRFASSPVITAVAARGGAATGGASSSNNNKSPVAMSARQRHASLRHVSTLAENTDLLGTDDEDEWYVGAGSRLQSFSSVADVINAAIIVDGDASQSSVGTSASMAGVTGGTPGGAPSGATPQKFASSSSVVSAMSNLSGASTVSEDGCSSDAGSVVGELVSFADMPRSKSLAGPRFFTQSNYRTLSQLSPIFQGGSSVGMGLQAQMQMQAQLQAQGQAQAQAQAQARILAPGTAANQALQGARQGAAQGLGLPRGVMEEDDDDTMYTASGAMRGDDDTMFDARGPAVVPDRAGGAAAARGGGMMTSTSSGAMVSGQTGGRPDDADVGTWQNAPGGVGGTLVASSMKPGMAAAMVAATAELINKSVAGGGMGRDAPILPVSPTRAAAAAADAGMGPGGLMRQVTAPGQLVRQSSLTFGRRMVSADSEDKVEMMDHATMMQRSNTALSVVEEVRGVQTIRAWSDAMGPGGGAAAQFGSSTGMGAAAAGGCVFARALQQGGARAPGADASPISPRKGGGGGMLRQPSSSAVGGGGGMLMRQPSNSMVNAGSSGGMMGGGGMVGGGGLQRQTSSSVVNRDGPAGGGMLQRQPSSSVVQHAGSSGAYTGGMMQRQSSGSMIAGAPTLMAGSTSSPSAIGGGMGGMMQRQPSGASVSFSVGAGVGGPLLRQASIGKDMVMADNSFVPPPVEPPVAMQRQKSGVFGWRDTKTDSFIPAHSEVAQQVQQQVSRAGSGGGGSGLTRSHTTPALFNPSAALPPRPRYEKAGSNGGGMMYRQNSSQQVGGGLSAAASNAASGVAAPYPSYGTSGSGLATSGSAIGMGMVIGGSSMVRSKTMGFGLDSSNYRNLANAQQQQQPLHYQGSTYSQGSGGINRNNDGGGGGGGGGRLTRPGRPQEGLHLRVPAPDVSPSHPLLHPLASALQGGPYQHSSPSSLAGGIAGSSTAASPTMSVPFGDPASAAASSAMRGDHMSDSPGTCSSARSVASPSTAAAGAGAWDNPVLLKVVVKDTGVGLSAEDIPRLFNKFVQADSSTTRQFRGTGLGLSISKRFVALMDGHIWIESDGLGKGSTLTFVIKLLRPVTGADWRRKGVVVDATTAQEALQDQLVMVCDDNRINRMVTRALLEKAGCRITMTESGQECLDKLADPSSEQPSVLLLDLCMPDMDGIEVCKRIRRGAVAGKVPPIVVVLTANADNDTKRRCFEAGVDAFMTKPMSLERLTQSLYELLRTHGRSMGRRGTPMKL